MHRRTRCGDDRDPDARPYPFQCTRSAQATLSPRLVRQPIRLRTTLSSALVTKTAAFGDSTVRLCRPCRPGFYLAGAMRASPAALLLRTTCGSTGVRATRDVNAMAEREPRTGKRTRTESGSLASTSATPIPTRRPTSFFGSLFQLVPSESEGLHDRIRERPTVSVRYGTIVADCRSRTRSGSAASRFDISCGNRPIRKPRAANWGDCRLSPSRQGAH